MLARIFPPPRFLEMPAVGLDVADRKVRFLNFKRVKNNELVIDRYGEMPIPPGAIISGNIKNVDEVKSVLTKFSKEHKLDFVRVSLPEERVYLVKMQTPVVNEDELRNSIMFQIEEYIPIPAKDAVFDYHILEKPKNSKGYLNIAVSAISRNELEEYLSVFEGTGMIPIDLEIEAQAIARAVVPKRETGTIMIVDFGRMRTGVSIVRDGIVRFTSTVELGSDMVTEALEKSFSIDRKEAEKMKNEKWLAKGGGNEEFFLAVISLISTLRDEINRLFIYWHTHRNSENNDAKIEKIILCGGGSNLQGFSDYLSMTLRIPVSVGSPWVNVNSFENYTPEIMFNESLGYSTVMGLALKTDFGI